LEETGEWCLASEFYQVVGDALTEASARSWPGCSPYGVYFSCFFFFRLLFAWRW
jgi:hypothetical protein